MTGVRPASPYKGLTPFADTAVDARLFFGRERDAEIVTANVVAARLTVLYGPSGVGKSSLLAAAVARSLRALPEQPVVVLFSAWSDDPAGALARAVAAEAGVEPGDNPVDTFVHASGLRGDVYLLLDQAEEYFLYHPEGGGLEQALAGILRAVPRANVLLSLREDALAKLDRFKAWIPSILDNYLRLDRLDREAGRLAVLCPLEQFAELTGERVEAEADLVERVLDEVGAGRIASGMGGLGAVSAGSSSYRAEAPYLQLVLQRLWEVEREARSSRLRLATLTGLGGARRIVRDHLERAVAGLDPAERDVAAALFTHLVTPSGTKIAHAPEDLAEYAAVPAAVVEGVAGRLVAERILRPTEGGRVEIFHDVLAGEVLDWRRRHDADRLLERERAEARRRHRRLGAVAVAALVALAVLAVLAGWALAERRESRQQAREARAQALSAEALLALDDDPQLSLLLASESARLSPEGLVGDVLRSALLADRVRLVLPADGAVTGIGYGPNGRTALVAGVSGEARVFDARTGRVVHRLVHEAAVVTASVGPGGLLAVTASADGSVRTWDVAGGREALLVPGPPPAVDASFRPAAGVLLAAARERVTVVRLQDGVVLATIEPDVTVEAAELSAEGGLVAVQGPDRLVRVYAVAGSGPRLLDQGSRVDSLAFAPSGTLLAAGGADGSVVLWDAAAGRRLATLEGHQGAVLDLAFSRNGRRLVSASADGTARIWNVAERRASQVLSGHTNYVTAAAFSNFGQSVVTGSRDGTARTWDARSGRTAAVLLGHGGAVTSVAFAPDGSQVLTGSADGTARAWDPGTRADLVPGGRAPAPAALTARSPDRTVTATADRNVVRLTGPGGERVLRRHTDRVNSVAFSPDGGRLVTAGRDHDVIVWDVATGEPTVLPPAHFGSVADARFSADGRWLVTAGPITAGLWDAATGLFVTYLRGPRSPLAAAAFEPDSRTIVTVERDGTVRRYACDVCGSVADLVAEAAARLAATGRELTPEKRARYLGEGA